MARLGLATSGKSLGRIEGYADLSAGDLAYIVRRSALTAVSIGALIAGLAATSAAFQGVAHAGLESELAGGKVLAVEPPGYAWRSGIRPGQTVLLLDAADDPDGWRIRTTDGINDFEAAAAPFESALRATLPLGVAAMLAACLAVLFLRTRRTWVLPASAVALLAASVTLRAQGAPDVSTAVMALAVGIPAGSIANRLPGRQWVQIGAEAALVGFIGVWAWCWLTGADGRLELESYRAALAVSATVILIAGRVVTPTLSRQRSPVIRPRLFDVAMVASLAAVAFMLADLLHAPLLVIAALLLMAVLFMPATRRRIARPIEDALLGDVRQAAASEAAEAERSRLARELHDVPLQELVGVIRRLEVLPGAEAESESLRSLAGHLRNVATGLRPPVLDDLGLPAAIEYLAEESTTDALPVTVDLSDETGFGEDRRPPGAVELAMYRIASEAVGNAIRHSGGGQVTIRGAVAPTRVELVIADDGAGLDGASAREAAKRKRLGLASMRRRAQAIDAELSIDGSPAGTRVRAVWQA
jgi:signal transduction histidine kinase